jgi:rhodanese-related sulfurtransferase
MRSTVFLFGLVLIALVAVVSLACGTASPAATPGNEVTVDGGTYRAINPAELKAMLDEEDFLLVNVHVPYEGEIPGTDLFVDYDKIERSLSALPEDKDAKIVLYCRSGSMSDTAARTLVDLGFTNVWDLDGGFVEWETQGYALVRGESPTAEPRTAFESDSVDVGMVPPGDALKHELRFRNAGKSPLTIEEVEARTLEGC